MGLEQQAVGVIEALTNLAQEFGPYLFAILFIVFVPRIAHGYYTACATRTAPPPGKQELNVYRLYFVSSVGVGIVVMGLSISWWFYQHAKTKFIYQISINDLSSYERVASEYYYRDNPHQSILPGVAATHDALFLIVRNEPFSIGQTLSFQYVMQTPDAPPGAGESDPGDYASCRRRAGAGAAVLLHASGTDGAAQSWRHGPRTNLPGHDAGGSCPRAGVLLTGLPAGRFENKGRLGLNSPIAPYSRPNFPAKVA
ncbi:MAG TPA: hypothetical protein VGF53_09600 [Pseudolabrys sp.]|jgi:hypothetical protein